MKSASSFLLAARRCEIGELQELARAGKLAAASSRLVHALQRERGLTCMSLGSPGTRFAAQRLRQVQECHAAEQGARAEFERLDTAQAPARNGARLFSRVAVALQGLQALPALRARVAQEAFPVPEAAAAFTRLIADLLAVVFEAADGATDPAIARALVALFNFMQGREFAGQECAFGAGAFAAGAVDAAGRQHWRYLVEAQQGCFQVFADCATPQLRRAGQVTGDPLLAAELERLRRLACGARTGPLEPQLSQRWYDRATRRIDAMHEVEAALLVELRVLCESRIGQARAELDDERMLLQALAVAAPESGSATAAAAPGTLARGHAAGAVAAAAGDERRTGRRARVARRAQDRRARQGPAHGAPSPERGRRLPGPAPDGDGSAAPPGAGCPRRARTGAGASLKKR